MKGIIKKLIFPAVIMTAACAAPKVAINPRADFSSIKRVAVMTFSGDKGDVAADMLTQSLIARGANVIERQQLSSILKEQQLSSSGQLNLDTVKSIGRILGVDAVFLGTVVESSPATSYLVSSSNDPIVATVSQVSGSSARPEGSVSGTTNMQTITTAAKISLLSRMVDVETGSVLWSASMSYEGFDIASAVAEITDAFTQSMVPIWPELIAKK